MIVPHVSLITAEHRREAREYLRRFLAEWAEREGILKGCRRAFFVVLSERGIPLGSQHYETLMACTDPDQVCQWALRALDANSPPASSADVRIRARLFFSPSGTSARAARATLA